MEHETNISKASQAKLSGAVHPRHSMVFVLYLNTILFIEAEAALAAAAVNVGCAPGHRQHTLQYPF